MPPSTLTQRLRAYAAGWKGPILITAADAQALSEVIEQAQGICDRQTLNEQLDRGAGALGLIPRVVDLGPLERALRRV